MGSRPSGRLELRLPAQQDQIPIFVITSQGFFGAAEHVRCQEKLMLVDADVGNFGGDVKILVVYAGDKAQVGTPAPLGKGMPNSRRRKPTA